MPRVLLRPLARTDLAAIWDFIGGDSPGRADAFLRQLDATLRVLGANPLMGRKRDELLPGVRSFAVGSCVIFYRPVSGGIDVIRVLHGARDLRSLLG